MNPKDWPQTEATVESSTQHHCNLAAAGGYVGKEYSITFHYQVNSRPYTGEFECSDPWEIGKKFCIHYDPADPATNTMCAHKEERWVYYVLAIVAVLAIAAYLWVAYAHIHG